VGLEHLFSELLVASVFDSVHLESVGVAVDVVVLGEEVADGVDGCTNGESHADDNLGVRHLVSSNEAEVLGDIMSHLRSRRGSSIVVLNHTVVQLRGHCNDHMVEVGIEVSSFWDIETEWWVVVVTGEQIV